MPAFIAGHYEFDDMHIDLRPLAQFANVQLIEAEISHIDLESKRLDIPGRPSITFDAISLNIGSQPNADLIKGAALNAIAVKPIDQFLRNWNQVFAEALLAIENNATFNLALVGGGPASVELAFAAHHRLHRAAGLTLTEKSSLNIKLVTNSSSVLSNANKQAQQLVIKELASRHIQIISNTKVIEFTPTSLVCESGETIETTQAIFATGASIPQWPLRSGLKESKDGFIEVNSYLQSTSHPFVFIAGDAATIEHQPRPKSGVYAVRQGKPLSKNPPRFGDCKSLGN